jgi:hypothetical protein
MAQAKPISVAFPCFLAPNYSPNNEQYGRDSIGAGNKVTTRHSRAYMFLVEFFYELQGGCENVPGKADIWLFSMLLGSKLLY